MTEVPQNGVAIIQVNCVTLRTIKLIYMKKNCLFAACAFAFMAWTSACDSGQGHKEGMDGIGELGRRVESAIEKIDAEVGVAMICGDDTLTLNHAVDYPLMSVFKLHIAVALMQQVDAGIISVDSVLTVPYSRLRPGTWSPMRDDAAGNDRDMTVDQLLRYSVCRSDNNACDILIDIAGGIATVNDSIRSLCPGDVALTETEASMHDDILRSYNNVSSPIALCTLLDRLYLGHVLSPASGRYLIELLGESTSGRAKISAGLPEGSFLGHKSGLSDRRPDGVLMASGDVAAFGCGNGKIASLAILVKDTPEPEARVDSLFAEIANLVHTHYSE